MAAFLVTGNPGSGKSTLAHELVRRGWPAIDPDDDPELSHWEDAKGRRVDGPQRPNDSWLRTHRWVWNPAGLAEVLAAHNGPVFVCGIARNQAELLGLFDQVFLLEIDGPTQEARLIAHDADHPPGRSEAGRQEIRDGRTVFETEMRGLGAIPLDGAAPTALLADHLLALTTTP